MILFWLGAGCGLLGNLFGGNQTDPETQLPSTEIVPTGTPPTLAETGDSGLVQIGPITDAFPVAASPAVDVLFVVDNSCGMLDAQASLSENFPSFFDFLEGTEIDYHIGVITTDTDNQPMAGVLRQSDGLRYITPDVADPVQVFDSMARPGQAGSGSERGLQAVYTMLEFKRDDPENLGFYRDDAWLHVVVLSDENDQSNNAVITLADWIRWFDGLKPNVEQRTVSAIVCVDATAACLGGQGSRYLDAVEQIGGITSNIVDADWPVVMERLGLLASSLSMAFELSETPLPQTLQVFVDRETASGTVTVQFDRAVFDGGDPPQLVDGEWVYQPATNSIAFQTFIPSPGDTVRVVYEVE